MSQIQSITLTPSTITLKEGEYYHLGTTIVPNTASVDLVWSSSNEYVCDVRSGVVYARHQGTSTITVVSNDPSRIGDSCVVTVEPAEIVPITQLVMNKTELFLPCGNSETIWATIYPSNASNRTLNWTSSNEYVAGVENGVVTARHQGVCTITAVSTDGTRVSTTCAVTVTPGNDRVEHITITPNNPTVPKNRTLQLTATVSPAEAVNKTVRWSSQNPEIASVDAASGLVCGHTEGTTTITAQAIDGSGVTASCVLTVAYVPVTNITLDKPSVVLNPGGNVCLIATVHPENATNQNVTWHSMDESVANVVNGVVQAHSIGRTTVYSRTTDPTGSRGFCDVRVVPTDFIPVSSVEVTPSELSMKLTDGPAFLSATVLPINATCACLKWASSNPNIATVDATTGMVMPISEGVTTISATAQDGSGKQSRCIVVVEEGNEVRIVNDGHYLNIHFKNGPTWKTIGAHPFKDSPILHEEWARYNFNITQDFTIEQIAYLYLFDPLAIECFVSNYPHAPGTSNVDILYFKDKVYEEIFGTRPTFFRIVPGQVVSLGEWPDIDEENRLKSYSDAETLFGYHTIGDALAWHQFMFHALHNLFGKLFEDFCTEYFDLDDDFWNAVNGASLAQSLMYSSAVTDTLADAAVSTAADKAFEYLEDYLFGPDGSTAKSMFSWGVAISRALIEAAIDTFVPPNPNDFTICKKVQSEKFLTKFVLSDDSEININEIVARWPSDE